MQVIYFKFSGSDIDVNVTGPVSTIINLKTTGVATRAKYRPVAPGEHSVSVLYEESHMRGSPFNVVVSGTDAQYKLQLRTNAFNLIITLN